VANPSVQPGTTVSSPVKKMKIPKPLLSVAAPKPKTTTTTTYTPDAAYWNQQFRADPRFLQQYPALGAQREQTSAKYGYYINRSPSGLATFKDPKTGVSGIAQVVDANGYPVLDAKGNYQYRDASGKTYSAAGLELDIRAVESGTPGYLEGELGSATALSQRKQQSIGDIAARSGARLSGQRASESIGESRRLSSEYKNIASNAARGLAGIGAQEQGLYGLVYGDLIKKPAVGKGVTKTTTTKPVLSPGKSGSFMKLADRILSNPQLTDNQKILLFGRIKKNYALSNKQVKWVDSWIKSRKPKA